jgi:hypothetical protein
MVVQYKQILALLPDYNGSYEVGIATGTDPTLEDAKKLRINIMIGSDEDTFKVLTADEAGIAWFVDNKTRFNRGLKRTISLGTITTLESEDQHMAGGSDDEEDENKESNAKKLKMSTSRVKKTGKTTESSGGQSSTSASTSIITGPTRHSMIRVIDGTTNEPVDIKSPEHRGMTQSNADNSRCMSAIAAATGVYIAERTNGNVKIRNFLVRAAYAIVMTGFFSFEDGDIVLAPDAIISEANDAASREVAAILDDTMISNALSVVIGTKINYWATNHHTGQGSLQGYARKVAMTKLALNTGELDGADWLEAIHRAGHWASTIVILGALNISDIRIVSTHFPPSDIVQASDMKLRVTAPPAGTHRHAVAYAIAKLLSLHPAAPLSDVLGCGAMDTVVKNYNKIKDTPGLYHTSASYLCGTCVTGFEDTAAENVLGRLCTFVDSFMSRSTISLSPHVSKKARTYPDYSDIYDSTLKSLLRAYKNPDRNKVALYVSLTSSVGSVVSLDNATKASQLFGNTRVEYDETSALIGKYLSDKALFDTAISATIQKEHADNRGAKQVEILKETADMRKSILKATQRGRNVDDEDEDGTGSNN